LGNNAVLYSLPIIFSILIFIGSLTI
jgi:hypothetical protein